MQKIETITKRLPPKTNKRQTDNKCISVWEYAGKILGDYNLERNGELQYSLFRWLRKNNTEKTGGLCEDGFFDYEATVIFPCDKNNVLLACTLWMELNTERIETLSGANDVAIIGNDSSGIYRIRRSNIISFYEAAMRAGYKEDGGYDRIIYQGKFGNFKFVTKSGADAVNVLRRNGSKTNPITGILFSTHGTPYAIDFNNEKGNWYIPERDMKELYERAHCKDGKKWCPEKNAVYTDSFAELVSEGVLAPDVTITLCGCLNGATGRNVPAGAEIVSRQWAVQNEVTPRNIAWYISKAIPEATVIANRTQVDSGKGLNSPVMYRNGEVVK